MAALIGGLGITGCGGGRGPAPFVHLGLYGDSATGGMMVGQGDTLWDIAKRYRLPVRDIIDLNRLEPPYRLVRGQRLKLPAPMEYRVGSGDTLNSIAHTFGVSIHRLAQINRLPAPFRIRPQQVLRIPSSYQRYFGTSSRELPVMQGSLVTPPTPDREDRGEGTMRQSTLLKSLLPVEAETLAPPVPAVKEIVPEVQKTRPMPVFSPRVPSETVAPRFGWPVRGKIISAYGPKEGGLYNDGINIAAPRGTPVIAAASGVVAYVGNDLDSYGNMVLVRHSGGMMTAYSHLASMKVKKGVTVAKGQPIGTVGSTGTVSAAQLHFEIRQGSKTFDPRKLL